jgi:probable phosphoglycerate mutase
MNATRIIAIRHGETEWNVDTRIQGQIDIGLNQNGFWQAKQVGQALADEGFAAIYTSDLSRAHETARALARHHDLIPIPHSSLRERHFGMFESKTWSEIEQLWPDEALNWRRRLPDWSPDGGESLNQLSERIEIVVNELAAKHLGQQIALVAHGGVMDVLYRLATRQPMQAQRSWSLGNAHINRLLWTPQGLTMVAWGDDRHLQAAARDESST